MNTENKSPSSSSASGGAGGGQRGGKRRRGGRGRRPQNKTAGNPNQQAAAPASRPNSNTKNNRNRRGASKRQRPRLTGFELVAANYDKILADHLEARKRYYEMYFRAQPAQRDKLERLFYESLDKLYHFAENVEQEFRDQFEQKINGLSFDRVYSERREISPEGEIEILSEDEIEDPHYLESQKAANYSDDTEESVGSLEDYKSYKGI